MSALSCQIFGVKDEHYLTKPLLINSFEKLYINFHKLSVDVYCMNPAHPAFKGVDGKELSNLETERVKRFEATYKPWKRPLVRALVWMEKKLENKKVL